MSNANRVDTPWRERLKKAGLRATVQRVSIVQALDRVGMPVSLERLHEELRQTVDLSTLYRNMKDFADAGLVRVIDIRHGHAHYELVHETEHHHVVCTECGCIEDFTYPACDAVASYALRQATRFAYVSDHAFEVYGTCNDCVAVSRPNTNKTR